MSISQAAEHSQEPNDTKADAGKEEDDDDNFPDLESAGNIRLMRNFAYPT